MSFSGLTGQMAQAEGLAPSSCGFGDRCFTLSYAYKKCPPSQPGWGLIHSHAADTPRRPHAAKRNRNGQLRICPPQTQKPQGGLPFLTAFDDSIIAWIFGFLMQILCFFSGISWNRSLCIAHHFVHIDYRQNNRRCFRLRSKQGHFSTSVRIQDCRCIFA